MDQSTPSSPVKSSSAIPRFSRLPTLKPAFSSAPPLGSQDAISSIPSPTKAPATRPTPVKPSLPQPATKSLSKRSSMIGTSSRLPPPKTHRATQSVQVSNNAASFSGIRPPSRPASRLVRPGSAKSNSYQNPSRLQDSDDQLGSLDGFRAASRQSSRAESPTMDHMDHFSTQTQSTPRTRKPARPSLSDRTVETISHLPPTPSTERRSSNFFSIQSPMGPPSRPASAMSTAMRPGSSDSAHGYSSIRAPTPTRRAPPTTRTNNRMSIDYSAARSTPSKRSSITAAPRTVQPSSKSVQPSSISRPSSSRLPSGSGSARIPGTPGASVSRLAHPQTSVRGPTEKRSTSVAAKERPASAASRRGAESPTNRMQPPAKPPASSSALRDQIAKARAAAKKATGAKPTMAQSDGADDYEFDLASDPFNSKPKDNNGLLLKRIDGARADGRLNIAAMGLKSIPDQVLCMYDADQMAKSKLTWSETVDLTHLMAADNEFEVIPDEVFPDTDAEAAEQDEDSAKGLQFRGLEVLDLHGNLLTAIPTGLRRLERLTVLNLSHNKFNNTVWDVLSQLDTLEELRLGHNNLTAYLPQGLSRLRNLRTLDLQFNKLLSLPESLQELVNLRVLNVSNNQLTGLPTDALETLPLTTLSVANNAMVGALFGFSVSGHPTLESLDISNNSLASLAFSESLSLPALKTLNIANNRIVALPDVSGWTKLASLAAGDNKISVLPTGFSTLADLKHADLTGNDIAKLPDELGLMASLENLNVSANPLKERKLLSMTTEQLKRSLRSRLKSDGVDNKPMPEDDFEDEGIEIQSPDHIQTWKLASGVLDLTGKDIANEDADELRQFLGANHEVRELVLAKNRLSIIPFEISLAQNLKTLDISNCSLEGEYLTELVNLQNLKELNIKANKIASWESLVDFFLAPNLEILDMSNNRLVGSLPVLKDSFPELKALHLRDNRIDAVSAEAVKGLHSIDLSNNNIGFLPPEIGLLWEQGLKGFSVSGNPFRVPSYRVLEKGTEATLMHLRSKIPQNNDGEEIEAEEETF